MVHLDVNATTDSPYATRAPNSAGRPHIVHHHYDLNQPEAAKKEKWLWGSV